MWISCSDNKLTSKAFNCLIQIKMEEGFDFGLVTTVQFNPDPPVKFNDTWYHVNQEQQKLWCFMAIFLYQLFIVSVLFIVN